MPRMRATCRRSAQRLTSHARLRLGQRILIAMLYHSRPPAPSLRRAAVVVLRRAAASEERILPSGTVELVINCRDDEIRIGDPAVPERLRRFSGAVVSRTYGRFFEIDTLQHAAMIGVHFRPGGASGLLGVPAGELADDWGPRGDFKKPRIAT